MKKYSIIIAFLVLVPIQLFAQDEQLYLRNDEIVETIASKIATRMAKDQEQIESIKNKITAAFDAYWKDTDSQYNEYIISDTAALKLPAEIKRLKKDIKELEKEKRRLSQGHEDIFKIDDRLRDEIGKVKKETEIAKTDMQEYDNTIASYNQYLAENKGTIALIKKEKEAKGRKDSEPQPQAKPTVVSQATGGSPMNLDQLLVEAETQMGKQFNEKKNNDILNRIGKLSASEQQQPKCQEIKEALKRQKETYQEICTFLNSVSYDNVFIKDAHARGRAKIDVDAAMKRLERSQYFRYYKNFQKVLKQLSEDMGAKSSKTWPTESSLRSYVDGLIKKL